MAHGAQATRRSDAQAREPPPGELGRPPVGTAPRSGASGAMLTERKRGRARKRHLLGWGQRRDKNHPGVWRYATPPASGGLCRPEVGVPFPARHERRQGPRREGSRPARWGPSRRPPPAGCADRRSAFPFLRVTSAARVRAERGVVPHVGVLPDARLRRAVPAPTGRTGQRSAQFSRWGLPDRRRHLAWWRTCET